MEWPASARPRTGSPKRTVTSHPNVPPSPRFWSSRAFPLPRRRVRPDTGALVSNAKVAETGHTAISGRHRVTARLIVRRVKDANHPDGLFPVRIPDPELILLRG